MNTVFKFYLQAWVLFGIAAGVCIVWIANRFGARAALPMHSIATTSNSADDDDKDNSNPSTDDTSKQVSTPGPNASRVTWRIWNAILALLIMLAALYPILATQAKINDRWAREAGAGLNSLAWMKSVIDTQYGPSAPEGHEFPLLRDYQALMWLRENIQGSPVVIEGAKAPPYRSLRSRVATYTGLPIVIGYSWHQKQQRSFLDVDLIGKRERDVDDFFNTTDPWLAREILNRYDVSLVYVGDLERVSYNPAGIEKFAQMTELGLLHPIYENAGVTIYRVLR